VGLHIGSLLSASLYAYIYDTQSGRCIQKLATTTILVYLWLTELVFNLVAPLATVVLNALVIRALRRSHRARSDELGCTQTTQKTSKASTTLMLLSVSFFYVATTLPMVFVYIIHPGFQIGDPLMTDQQVYYILHYMRVASLGLRAWRRIVQWLARWLDQRS